jgi:type II secretory pathway component PulC
MLLAALAMGCAQAGWTLLTPGAASAIGSTEEDDIAPRLEAAAVHSPFAPEADASSMASHAVAALLSSIELNGVRMSTDPARDGAMFTLSGGEHRAYIVGQEITDGVTLMDVEDGYVVLGYSGGQHRLDLRQPEGVSYARALMGLEPSPSAATVSETVIADAEPDRALATTSPEPARPLAAAAVLETTPFQSQAESLAVSEMAPLFTITPLEPEAVATSDASVDASALAALLGHVETRDGRSVGWRLGEETVAVVGAYGLRSGDLILSVNGAGPGNALAAMASLRSGNVVLEIERDGVGQTVVIDVGDRT